MNPNRFSYTIVIVENFGDPCGYEGREHCQNTRCLHRPLLLKSRLLGKILWVNVSLTKPGYNNHLLFLKVSRILTKPHRTFKVR